MQTKRKKIIISLLTGILILMLIFIYNILDIINYFYEIYYHKVYIPKYVNELIYNDSTIKGRFVERIQIDSVYDLTFYADYYADILHVYREKRSTKEIKFIYRIVDYKFHIYYDTLNKPTVNLILDTSYSNRDDLQNIVIDPYIEKYDWYDPRTNLSFFKKRK